jgi:hypothetical protein
VNACTMHTDTGNADAVGGDSITASSLTYCQAVLWIGPLLATIEKANNQLTGISKIELERKQLGKIMELKDRDVKVVNHFK